MERIEPTRMWAFKLWWSFVWRAGLFALLSGLAVGVVFGLLGALLRLSPDIMGSISGLLGLVLGIAMSVEAMYRVLRKRFKGYEIALISSPE